MTAYLGGKFSVTPALSKAYRDNYDTVFGQRDDVTEKITRPAKFVCDVCGEQFVDLQDLRKHLCEKE